jgi:O-antigen ligase
MDLDTGHALQLGIALLFGIGLFAAVYALPERIILGILIVMIPFQPIMSRYGSLNMVLTYLVGAALLLKGRIKYYPLLMSVFFIFVAYFLSTSVALRATLKDHIFYLVAIGGNFVLFYMVYNYFRQSGDYRYAFKVMIWMNILVVLYGFIQLSVGFDKFAFMGISEFGFATQLEHKQRLVGTFGAAGVNAEYFALQILLVGYMIMHESRKHVKTLLLMLVATNFALQVATGSRGSFLSLMGGIVLFIWFFRKELGAIAIARITVFGGALFVASALIMINYTDFNVLFERLGNTEFEGGVPDTRQGAFGAATERIPEAIVLGHGPRLKLIEEETRRIPGYIPLGSYPHNLVLFLLYTVGIVGLVAYVVFFAAMFMRFKDANKYQCDDALRFKLNDSQNYLFTLWAVMLAFSDILVNKAKKQKSEIRSNEPSTNILNRAPAAGSKQSL